MDTIVQYDPYFFHKMDAFPKKSNDLQKHIKTQLIEKINKFDH
jgi:hypothetical protein